MNTITLIAIIQLVSIVLIAVFNKVLINKKIVPGIFCYFFQTLVIVCSIIYYFYIYKGSSSIQGVVALFLVGLAATILSSAFMLIKK